MATINWDSVLQQTLQAVTKSLGASWGAVSVGAINAVQTMVQTAQYIEANRAQLDATDQKLLTDAQQNAMQSVLLGYKDIGIVAAEAAVASAWGVVQVALTAALAAI
jgi:hypothetical protein